MRKAPTLTEARSSDGFDLPGGPNPEDVTCYLLHIQTADFPSVNEAQRDVEAEHGWDWQDFWQTWSAQMCQKALFRVLVKQFSCNAKMFPGQVKTRSKLVWGEVMVVIVKVIRGRGSHCSSAFNLGKVQASIRDRPRNKETGLDVKTGNKEWLKSSRSDGSLKGAGKNRWSRSGD